MTELLTAAQMRAIETAAIASGEVTGLELMERAGAGVVEAVLEEWPELAEGPHRAVVLCGPGNNGGDGFVVARLLKERGWEVECLLYGDPERLPPDARTNFDRCGVPITLRKIDPPPLADDSFSTKMKVDLLFDGLFGTGLTRPMKGIAGGFTAIARFLRDQGVLVTAIDIPSGLSADVGEVLGHSIKADLTVTFHGAKVGHFKADGPEYCGNVVVKDIGL